MSVFTRVERAQLEAFLATYEQGDLVEFAGVSDGIVNTNYFVTTSGGRFVLTLFEELGAEELPYFIELMRFAHRHGVPCALPIADRDDQYLRELCGRPALLVERLNGRAVASPSLTQCRAIGAALADLHRAGTDFPLHRRTDHGRAWHTMAAERVLPLLSTEDADLLTGEMRFQAAQAYDSLPRGLTHGDLFRDNALFEGERLCGIIDFYYACDHILAHDLAVVVNDWCSEGHGRLDAGRAAALLDAYTATRPLTEDEYRLWSAMLRAAALRYWLSRLYDLHFPRPGDITHAKDPNHFKWILLNHRQAQAGTIASYLSTDD